MKYRLALAAGTAMALTLPATPASAQATPFIGQIMPVGYTFCPRGFADADGQLLSIAQNTALFSLYGTTYGGDGRTTFALPDLRGRVPIHVGQGPGLTDRRLGSRSGSETNTLSVLNLPAHNHTAAVNINNTVPADSGNPTLNHFARSANRIYQNTEGASPGATMAPDTVTIGNTGGGQAVNNMQPYQVIRYCVALQGIFPSRN